MEFHPGLSTSPAFKTPTGVSDRTSGLLRCGDWDTTPASACSGLLRRASVEPDKPLSRRSGSTGQHVAGGESCTLMSRLVVSFPGCADRLEDVVLFSVPSGSPNQVGGLDGTEHSRDDPMGIVVSPMTPSIPYDADERQAVSLCGASPSPPQWMSGGNRGPGQMDRSTAFTGPFLACSATHFQDLQRFPESATAVFSALTHGPQRLQRSPIQGQIWRWSLTIDCDTRWSPRWSNRCP